MLSPRLAALLGTSSLREVTEAHLQAVIGANISEDQDLDFKQARYDYGPVGTFELAKDVAALANQVGGLLVLGIAEDQQGRATALKPLKLDDSENGRIRQVIADRCYPMVTDVEVHEVPTANDPVAGYYLIFVPRSVQAPHAVRQKDPKPLWLCYPLRHGTTTHYLTETEIAARYRDRFALARSQVDRLERIHTDGRRTESPQALAIAVGLVPAIPGNRSLTGDRPTITDFVSTWHAQRGELNGTALGNHRVARRRLRCGNDSVAMELYTDGTGWVRHLGGSGIGRDELIVRADDLETYIVELLALLGGYAAWAGAAGDCAISVSLYGGAASGGGATGRVGLRPDRRRTDVLWVDGQLPEAAETTVPIGELASDRERVGVAAYPLARDLEQDWGLPEPAALQPNGTFVYV